MRTVYERLVIVATLVSVALAMSQGSSQSLVIVGVATALLVSAVRCAAVVIGSPEVTIGTRARAHREALSGMPAPRHPSTAGLPLTRAPSQGLAA